MINAHWIYITLLVVCCGVVGVRMGSGHGPEKAPTKNIQGSSVAFTPQFVTGYEPGEITTSAGDTLGWISFANTSTHPEAAPWAMSVFYEKPGTAADRYARIVDDPTAGEDNKVLHYWLKNAVIDSGYQQHTKGRIQTGFPGQLTDAVEVYSRQRIFLHEDLNLLHDYPANGDPWWHSIILQEFWMGAAWEGHPNPSRISLAMFPFRGKMYLNLSHQAMPEMETIWDKQRLNLALPIGEWFTLEIGYKSGDAQSGRMVVVVTPESTNQRRVFFDVSDWTYDPDADQAGGTGPVAMTHWNPQKLYSSDNMIHFIRDNGGVAQAYFDDFAFGGQWPARWPE